MRTSQHSILSLFENRPDPAGILYPYFEEELKSRGFEIGSRSKEYVRFTSKVGGAAAEGWRRLAR
jgi:hypothetical protein